MSEFMAYVYKEEHCLATISGCCIETVMAEAHFIAEKGDPEEEVSIYLYRQTDDDGEMVKVLNTHLYPQF